MTMCIQQIKFDYDAGKRWKELSDEKRKELEPIVKKCLSDNKLDFHSWVELIVDEIEATALSEAEIHYTVTRFKGLNPTLIKWGANDGAPATHIHLPNFDLVSFNEVTWLEDCCTEQLQKELDDGWRILAICPPLSERRPTYILGRKKSQ